MSLLRSTVVVGGLTGLSRVLGFVREILLARVLGAGPISDAFVNALRFPNLFRRVLAEGAFNAAFVPQYARRLEASDGENGETAQAAADRFASETFAVLMVILIGLVLVAQLAMPWLIKGLMAGYADDPEWTAKAALMAQITMPYIAFMSLTAMFGGVLNARRRFAAFAFAPVLLNVVLIGVLLLAPGGAWEAAYALSWGVTGAGVLQCAVVYWGLKRDGVALTLRLPRLTPGVKKTLALAAPGALAAGVTQINIVISQTIASFTEGAASWLYYADRLYQLPLGMIGVAMGVTLLPSLSRLVKAGNDAGASEAMANGLEIAAFFTLPAAVALAAAPQFWVAGLFENGAFTAQDTHNTAMALLAFSFGLPAFILAKVFAPGYFAREDTKTPMVFAIISMVVNVVLGVALYVVMGFVGLAIATSVAGWVNVGLLGLGLARRGAFRLAATQARRLLALIGAAVAMGGAVWWLAGREAGLLATRLGGLAIADIGWCLVAAGVGGAVFIAFAFGLRGVTPARLRAALRR